MMVAGILERNSFPIRCLRCFIKIDGFLLEEIWGGCYPLMEIPQFFLPKSYTLSLINKKIAPPDKILLYGPKHNRILPQMPINTHKCSKSSHQSRGPSWRLQRHLPLKPPRRAVGDGSDDTDDGRSPRCRPTPRRWGDGAEEEAGEAGSGGPCHDCYTPTLGSTETRIGKATLWSCPVLSEWSTWMAKFPNLAVNCGNPEGWAHNFCGLQRNWGEQQKNALKG